MKKDTVEALATKLAEAMLAEHGEAWLENPMGADHAILMALRKVGESTTTKVLRATTSKLVEQEKKDRG